jgi:hypothetical protein
MSAWKDDTSYSKYRLKGETEPDTWIVQLLKDAVIIVARDRYYKPDDWVLVCDTLNIERPLKAKDIESAKLEAVSVVRNYLLDLLKVVDRID